MKLKYKFFYNYAFKKLLFIFRTKIFFLLILFFFVILFINIYYLQVVRFKDYNLISNKNRIKIIPINGYRGIIYDRNKIPLAINRINYQLQIIPDHIKNLSKTLNELRFLLNISDLEINLFKIKYQQNQRFKPIFLKKLNEIEIATFLTQKYRFPGVKIKKNYFRYYPYKFYLTHAIGYVSKTKKDIYSNVSIGKVGIEKFYEKILHGKNGYKAFEVNNFGHIIRKLYEKIPQYGYDIILSIDLNLQIFIKNLLDKNNRAAIIVSDSRNGEILSMISNPSYDPNLFISGISKKNYKILIKDKNLPLINRVTQGTYPPASTVKPYIGIAALTKKIISKNTILRDPGWWQLPKSKKKYRDWKKWGHGYVNLKKSLEESSDTFFYQIAYNMGIDNIFIWMKKFGYGSLTGIDLMEENSGIMPNKKWKVKRFKEPWYSGDTISIGIGQGYWTATPVQMNKALITLINNGNILIPHFFLSSCIKKKSVLKKTNNFKEVDINFWKIIKDGMYGVAHRINGTAYRYFKNLSYKIGAKSGSAQVYSIKKDFFYDEKKIPYYLRDHKLMIVFAPYKFPRYAITIILENGNTKNVKIGHVMRKILNFLILELKIKI